MRAPSKVLEAVMDAMGCDRHAASDMRGVVYCATHRCAWLSDMDACLHAICVADDNFTAAMEDAQ